VTSSDRAGVTTSPRDQGKGTDAGAVATTAAAATAVAATTAAGTAAAATTAGAKAGSIVPPGAPPLIPPPAAGPIPTKVDPFKGGPTDKLETPSKFDAPLKFEAPPKVDSDKFGTDRVGTDKVGTASTPPKVETPVKRDDIPPKVEPGKFQAAKKDDQTAKTDDLAKSVGVVKTGDKPTDDVAKTDEAAKIGAPDESSEPKKTEPLTLGSRFVGAAALSGMPSPESAAAPEEEPRDVLTPPPPPVRDRRVSGRVVILVIVVVLVIAGLGGWYYQRHHSKAGHVPPTSAQIDSDVALAAHVGVQAGDLSGWKTTPGSPGSAFTSVVTPSAAATAAEKSATSTLAQCLKVPTAQVTRAFDGTSPARTALSTTPVYNNPTTAGITAGSAVATMTGPASEHTDFKVFSDTTTFATCYKPYAQAMLPYAANTATAFTSVNVAATSVPTIANSRLHVAAFEIIRTAGSASTVTTAVAIFGGRLQTILALTSPTTSFPPTTETPLLNAIEGRVAANLPAK
jgi:hypothetical protein